MKQQKNVSLKFHTIKKCVGLLLLVTLGFLLGACGRTTPPVKPVERSSQAMQFGEVQTTLPDFQVTPPKKIWQYPTPLEQNGLYGYQDREGNIVVPPRYERVGEFAYGYGSLRMPKEEGSNEYQWRYVDGNGNFLEYDYIGGFLRQGELLFGLALVSKDEKFGLMNTAWQEVVPLEYDSLTYYLGQESPNYYAYGSKGGKWYRLDLQSGTVSAYEVYDEKNAENYAAELDLDQWQNRLLVVNDMLLCDGRPASLNQDIPWAVLDHLQVQLYQDTRKIGFAPAALTVGTYEGELQIQFSKAYDDQGFGYEDGQNPNYLGLIGEGNCLPRQVELLEDTSAYLPTLETFLAAVEAPETPAEISRVLTGDFFDNGTTSAVVELNDTIRKMDYDQVPPWTEWLEADFRKRGVAFCNALLLVPDVTKPRQYLPVTSNVWRHTNLDYVTQKAAFVADVDGDGIYEVVLDKRYYEWRDYQVVELPGEGGGKMQPQF